jgi:hypothetical protein
MEDEIMKEHSKGLLENDAYAGLNDDDRRLLQLWRETLIVQDRRYESKVLLRAVVEAMRDETARARIVDEGYDFLSPARKDFDHLGAVSKVKFLENTAEILYVVLPPRAGTVSGRSQNIRDALKSRTDPASERINRDDWDLKGDFFDDFGHIDGDRHPSDRPPQTI